MDNFKSKERKGMNQHWLVHYAKKLGYLIRELNISSPLAEYSMLQGELNKTQFYQTLVLFWEHCHYQYLGYSPAEIESSLEAKINHLKAGQGISPSDSAQSGELSEALQVSRKKLITQKTLSLAEWRDLALFLRSFEEPSLPKTVARKSVRESSETMKTQLDFGSTPSPPGVSAEKSQRIPVNSGDATIADFGNSAPQVAPEDATVNDMQAPPPPVNLSQTIVRTPNKIGGSSETMLDFSSLPSPQNPEQPINPGDATIADFGGSAPKIAPEDATINDMQASPSPPSLPPLSQTVFRSPQDLGGGNETLIDYSQIPDRAQEEVLDATITDMSDKTSSKEGGIYSTEGNFSAQEPQLPPLSQTVVRSFDQNPVNPGDETLVNLPEENALPPMAQTFQRDKNDVFESNETVQDLMLGQGRGGEIQDASTPSFLGQGASPHSNHSLAQPSQPSFTQDPDQTNDDANIAAISPPSHSPASQPSIPRRQISQPSIQQPQNTRMRQVSENRKMNATLPLVDQPQRRSLGMFGAYELQAEIGAGGMGKVYKAFHPQLQRTVAIKVMLRSGAEHSEERKRFLTEARLTAKLRHPNIVAVHDSGTLDGTDFIVMDFVKGSTLQDVIKEKTLSIRQSLEVMRGMAAAMNYAHENSVIHRDLKPANVIIEEETQRPLIMDFGLAKNIELSVDQTRDGQIMGTPRYMPPEQAEGNLKKISPKTDQYALGAILYEMLVGQPAVEGDAPATIIYNVLYKEILPPKTYNPKLSDDLQTICLKSLEKDIDRRYDSCGNMAQDIESFLNGEVISARPTTFWYRSWKKIKRNKWTSMAVAAGLLGVIAISSWFLYQIEAEKQARFQEKQAKIEDAIIQSGRFMSSSVNAKTLSESYPKGALYEEISPQEEQERLAALKEYKENRKKVEDTLVLEPEHEQLKEKLFQLEKEIGLIALDARLYILSEFSFERCKSLGYEKEGTELFEILEESRSALKNSRLERINFIMEDLKSNIPSAGILDQYVTEIVRMQSSYVVEKMISYIFPGNQWQRQVAIESLGKLGNVSTQVEEKDSVQWLLNRLGKVQLIQDVEEMEQIIWALGRLRDPRANKLVYEARWDMGYQSVFWERTRIPHLWIFESITAEKKGKTLEEWVVQGIMKTEMRDFAGAAADFSEAINLDPKRPELYNNRGNAYKSMGEPSKALLDYAKALEVDPEYVNAYINRALIRQNQKDFFGAVDDFNKAVQIDPQNIDSYINLGNAYQAQGNLEEAIDNYTTAIEINPWDAYPYNNRGIARREKGDITGAKVDFSRAIEINPQDPAPFVNRGNIQKRQGNLPQALADYTAALRNDPQNVKAYYNRGLIHLLQKKPHEAMTDFSRALRVDDSFTLAYLSRGDARQDLGDLNGAFGDYTAALNLDDKNAMAYRGRGILYDKRREQEKALSDFARSMELNPKDPLVYFYRGNIYLEQRKVDDAIADYIEAIKYDSGQANFFKNVALAYQQKGDFTKAHQGYLRALKIDPNNEETYLLRGKLYLEEGKYDKASGDFSESLRINEKNVEAYLQRAISYQQGGKLKDALGDYTTVINRRPRDVLAYSYRGLVRKQLKDLSGALTDLDKALQLRPENADAFYYRALIKMDQKDPSSALLDFNQAMELGYKDAEVYRDRGKAYLDSEEVEKSLADFGKALELTSKDAQIYLYRGLAYKKQEKFDEALDDFNLVIKYDPAHIEGYLERGKVLRAAKKFKEAFLDFNQAARLAPRNPEVYNNRGELWYNMDKLPRAIKDFTQAIKVDSNNIKAYNSRGLTYKKMGENSRASDDFTRAIRLAPDEEEAYINRGELFLDGKKWELALDDFNEAIRCNPESAVGYHYRGLVKKNLGESIEALGDYTKVIELKPNIDSYLNRGDIYQESKEHNKALSDYNAALKLNNEDAYAYNRRGLAYHALNQYDKAIEDFSKAIELADFEEAFKNRGFTYHKMGKTAEAAQDFEEYLELGLNDPQNGQLKSYVDRYGQ